MLYNVFALFDDTGNLTITYNKAHPVPLVEANIQAGPDVLQVILPPIQPHMTDPAAF